MLNELKRIVIFNKVVECGSFTCAAEALGMTKSKETANKSCNLGIERGFERLA